MSIRNGYVCHYSIYGSPAPGANSESTTFIPAGLIKEGPVQLRVAHHTWTGYIEPWDEIGDSRHQHKEGLQTG